MEVFDMVKSLSVAEKFPDSLNFWDYEKNNCTPYDVSYGTCTRYYWLCKEGHSSCATPKDKAKHGFPCGVCSGRQLLVGFNDLWTTHPHIAKLLENPEDGYTVTYGSRKRFNWKCPICGNIIKNKEVNCVTSNGLVCNMCSDGISYPEKMFSSLLNELGVDYIYQLSNRYDGFEWCEKYRYDFYLPDTNTIVEINGGFHYNYEYKYSNAKTLQEVKNNDANKMKTATKNGIINYIQIDARKSDFNFIKENIINSSLFQLYNLENINWVNVERNIIDNMLLSVCNFYNENQNNTIQDISTKFKIHYDTVSKYLNKGKELGLCSYNSKAHQIKMIRKNHYKRPVICITTNKTFNSTKEAGDFYGVRQSNISSCCSGVLKTSGQLEDGTRLVWKYV